MSAEWEAVEKAVEALGDAGRAWQSYAERVEAKVNAIEAREKDVTNRETLLAGAWAAFEASNADRAAALEVRELAVRRREQAVEGLRQTLAETRVQRDAAYGREATEQAKRRAAGNEAASLRQEVKRLEAALVDALKRREGLVTKT